MQPRNTEAEQQKLLQKQNQKINVRWLLNWKASTNFSAFLKLLKKDEVLR